MPLPLAQASQPQRASSSHSISAPAAALECPAPLRLWHLASLDAPTVAVVWSLAFAHAAAVRLPAWLPVLIGLGTWAVYIGDRLLDARSALRTGQFDALRDRHFFHWRHRRALVPAAAIAALAALVLIAVFMPAHLRERDSVLAAAALAYFSGVHLPRSPRWLAPLLSKELLVGVLFTAGCVLPTLTRLPRTNLAQVLLAASFFAALAWLNCHAIDRWEAAPAAHIAGKAAVIAALGCAAAFACSFAGLHIGLLLAAGSASAALIAALDHARPRLTPLALRAAADLVLLTPLALLLAR